MLPLGKKWARGTPHAQEDVGLCITQGHVQAAPNLVAKPGMQRYEQLIAGLLVPGNGLMHQLR